MSHKLTTPAAVAATLVALMASPVRAADYVQAAGSTLAFATKYDGEVFTGCERFFRPGYAANLVGSWIPALDGVEARMKAGASVADVGCDAPRPLVHNSV